MADPADAADPADPPPPQTVGEALRLIVTTRLGGALFAVAGVLLIVAVLLAVRGDGDGDGDGDGGPGTVAVSSSVPPASSAPASPPATTATTRPPASTTAPAPPPPRPPTSAAPPRPTRPAPPRAAVTVLNNSVVRGLASDVAAELGAGGWTVARVGNFTGRIPSTTVYFTPGNQAEERAAHALADQFGKIRRVLPRFDGLPVSGMVVVVTRDWVSG